jgi:hypothetical protein
MLFYPPELLDTIERLGTTALRNTIVFRHMLVAAPVTPVGDEQDAASTMQ